MWPPHRCIPCAFIPFCSSRLNVTEHYCPNCKKSFWLPIDWCDLYIYFSVETFWHGNISGDILLGKYKGWKGRAAPWRNVRTQEIWEMGWKDLCKTMWNKIWTDQDVKFQFFREEWWTIFKLWQHLWHFGFHCKINIFAKEIFVPMWDIRGQTWVMVTC